jgi:hypothetical protein
MGKDVALPAARVDTLGLASAVTGYLLCGIGQVYTAIEQITGIAPMTHQLPRMGRELAAHVREHLPGFPDKAAAEAYPVNGQTFSAFAAELVERFGPSVSVPKQEVARRDPIEELVNMAGPEKVIVVAAPNPSPEPSHDN